MTQRHAAIISLNGSVNGENLTSHRSAWAIMRRSQLLETGIFDQVEIGQEHVAGATDIIYYWGMEWTGVLNLFGGAIQTNGDRLRQPILHHKQGKKLWSLDCYMPDLGELAQRRDAMSKPGWIDPKNPWSKLSKICNTDVEPLIQKRGMFDRWVIGDSHALSLWAPGSFIDRRDHQSLYGILKVGLDRLEEPFLELQVRNQRRVTFYFGNIDVRHHLARQANPIAAAEDLAKEYVKQAAKYQGLHGYRVQLAEILPICSDDRRIPQTGWYKGTAYAGEWELRDNIRIAFNRKLRTLSRMKGLDIPFVWPQWISDGNGMLKDEYMEKPGSVHLAWLTTRRMIELGVLE